MKRFTTDRMLLLYHADRSRSDLNLKIFRLTFPHPATPACFGFCLQHKIAECQRLYAVNMLLFSLNQQVVLPDLRKFSYFNTSVH